MEQRQLPAQVEPQPGSGDVAVLGGHDPTEAAEEPRQVVPGDPQAVVGDRHLRGVGGELDSGLDDASPRAVLDGVVEQVAEDGQEAAVVGEHHHRLVHRHHLQDVLRQRARPDPFQGFDQHLPQVLPLQLQVQLAVLEPRRLQHLLDQLADLAQLAVDDLQDPRRGRMLRPDRAVGEH